MSGKNALMNSLNFSQQTSFFGFKSPAKPQAPFMYGCASSLLEGSFLKKKLEKFFGNGLGAGIVGKKLLFARRDFKVLEFEMFNVA